MISITDIYRITAILTIRIERIGTLYSYNNKARRKIELIDGLNLVLFSPSRMVYREVAKGYDQ